MNAVDQHIQNAKEVIYGNGTMDEARKVFDSVKDEIKAIQGDRTLSAIGIAEKEREAKRKGAGELAKIVQSNKAVVDKELDAAEKAARAVLATPSAQPAQAVIDDFDEKYRELKTELTVFGGEATARKFLDFMNGVTDPYFAKALKDDFAEYGPHLQRSSSDKMRVRGTYDKLKQVAETDAQALARKALEEIGSLRRSVPVNSMISLGIDSALGTEYRAVLTNHTQYLDK